MSSFPPRALLAVAAALHVACTAAGGEARPARPAPSAVEAEPPFVQVLHHQRDVQAEVDDAFRAWAMPQNLSFAMEPDNRVRVATRVHAAPAAMRALPEGEREIIGSAVFSAGRPEAYEYFKAHRAFRMVLAPDGIVRSAKLEGARLDAPGIVRPVFEPLEEAEARAFKRRLDVFLHEPAQASWLQTYLWAAIAGEPTTHTYQLHAARATKGAFGAFGRVVRFRGTLARDGRAVPGYTNFEIEVVTDRGGRVIAAGDPTQ